MCARVGIVSGSGLDLRGILDTARMELPFPDGPGGTGVAGHEGRFLFGRCGAVEVVLQCGRRHFYEGLTFAQVTAPVDALRDFGARTVVFTNAAGGLEPWMRPGHFLGVNRVLAHPYMGWPGGPESIEPDFTPPGCDGTGAYAWVHGPSYETRAEIRALRGLGAAAVGMSTAPELARCRELGLFAGAVSCITNNCCSPSRLTHDEVLREGERASQRLTELLRGMIGRGDLPGMA